MAEMEFQVCRILLLSSAAIEYVVEGDYDHAFLVKLFSNII